MNKKFWNVYILIAVTALLITATGIIFKQPFLRILPLYFSLVIMLLNADINRYGALLGGLNSILYGVTYVHYNLYASAAYALAVSFPIQIITFILWTKRKDGRTTKLRKMTAKQRILAAVVSLVSWGVVMYILQLMGGNHSFLDNTNAILSVIITFMTMFAFVEYTYLAILSGIVVVFLNLSLAVESPEMLTYLIYSLYSFICVVRAFFRAKWIYKEQNQRRDTV